MDSPPEVPGAAAAAEPYRGVPASPDDPRLARIPEGTQAPLYPLLMLVLWLYRIVMIRRVKVIGRENIPDTGAIVVSNHTRASDAFLLPFILRRRVHGLGQAEIFTLPFIGPLFAQSGQIPVIKGHGDLALAKAKAYLAIDEHVLIYPEGRLTHDTRKRRGKAGAARLALETGATILPIGVYARERNTRVLYGQMFERRTIGGWQFGGPACVVIGKPYKMFDSLAQAVSHRELVQATRRMMDGIYQLVDKAQAALD